MTVGIRDLGVAGLSRELAAGRIGSVELTQELLAAVNADLAAGPAGLGAFLAVDADAALAQAREADARRAAGGAGALTGVPLAHKDIFVTDFSSSHVPSTAGSKMLAGYQSPFDATVVARLGQGESGGAPGAGMVTLGKLNCDEFAMGSSNENSAFGPVKNP
jgi:aspartyl-tRNA(Asn)/glutamyl-tRNA(Gln) amidotransferase subunit A